MAFVNDGVLKLQVKNYVYKNYGHTAQILQASDLNSLKMTNDEILNCLNQPNHHDVFPDFRMVILKPFGERGPKKQIALQEVSHLCSFDTEMAFVSLVDLKR